MGHYDWTVGRIPDLKCEVRASGALTANTDKIMHYYRMLEITDLDFQCVSPALLDKSA